LDQKPGLKQAGIKTAVRPLRLGSTARTSLLFIGTSLLAGCVGAQVPLNTSADLYSKEHSKIAGKIKPRSSLKGRDACSAAGTPAFIVPSALGKKTKRRFEIPPMRYSPGDRFNILILDAPEFSGDYAVNIDGRVLLPFAGQIKAAGLTNAQLSRSISRALVDKGIFSKRAAQVSVRPVQYAPVNVTVAGAVFNPGRHAINNIKHNERLEKVIAKSGDSPIHRRVPAALLAAGGVRPDADLADIKVTRDGRVFELDWRGAFTGSNVDDLPLIEGDHIEVGETGCFQSELARPSQITPTGINLFISNLTAPAYNNAATVRNQNSSGGVPYGTRLLQGLVEANCIGGTYSTNARRYAVLITRNPKTRKTEVVQLSVEDLVRRADRDTFNPFLMPDDSIACYDSAVTEFRDVAAMITNIAGAVRGGGSN
jgi:protein involved in polysaccharide export with SLBB domain